METAPFAGVVLCCTSIPIDLRTELARKVTELGGVHNNDLTHEVTHLIVGDYNTAKYRHVATQRPDIRPMCAGWVDAVMELWTRDAAIDRRALEDAWSLRTFEAHGGLPAGANGQVVERRRLLVSVSGFEEGERQRVITKIVDHGGVYCGDMTRSVSHLVVQQPSGKKYEAALQWDIKTVGVEWLDDCIARGMILDEAGYNPRLAAEERGKGLSSWVRDASERAAILGKRRRDAEAAAAAALAKQQGPRKLRKTASQKLAVQRDRLWGDILRGGVEKVSNEPKVSDKVPRSRDSNVIVVANKDDQHDGHTELETDDDAARLRNSIFCIHGFSAARHGIAASAVATVGATVATSLEHMATLAAGRSPPPLQHVVVPQDTSPSSHPTVPSDVLLVTEFFLERCLSTRRYPFPVPLPPADTPDASVIGRPFPVFPIQSFDTLAISTAGFSGVDLNHVDKTVRQLGARYEERFTPQRSLLLVTALAAVRPAKLDLALVHRVPVVHVRWLWACIAAGELCPVTPFLFPELRQPPLPRGLLADGVSRAPTAVPDAAPDATQHLTVATLVEPNPRALFVTPHPPSPPAPAADASMSTTAAYETAPTQQSVAPPAPSTRPAKPVFAQASIGAAAAFPVDDEDIDDDDGDERSRLNKSATPTRPAVRQPLARVVSEIADSVADDDEGDVRVPQPLPAPAPAVPVLRRSATTQQQAPGPRTMLSRVASDGSRPASAVAALSSRRLPPAQPPAQLGHAQPAPPLGISLGELMADSETAGRGKSLRRGGGGLQRTSSAMSGRGALDATSGGTEAVAVAKAPDGTTAASDADAGAGVGVAPLEASPSQIEVQYLEPEAEMFREQLLRKIRSAGPDGPAGEDDDVQAGVGTAEDYTGGDDSVATALAQLSRRRSGRLRVRRMT